MMCNILTVACVLKAGCSPDMLSDSGSAPVHLAANQGQIVIIALLQKMGANIAIKDSMVSVYFVISI